MDISGRFQTEKLPHFIVIWRAFLQVRSAKKAFTQITRFEKLLGYPISVNDCKPY